jgi:lipopolysaccharide cholinephosphotransferase
MDFGIPREHYDRFQKIAETELTKQYSLLTVNNSKRVISDISKLVLNTTVIEEEFVKDPAMQIGVFIDIFPLDRTDGNLGCLSKNKWIRYLIDLSGYRYLSLHNRPFFKKTLAVIVKFFLAPVPPKSIVNFIKKRLITGSGDHIANHYGAWKTKEIMPEKHFGQPQLYPFEDTEFYGVSDPNGYLSHLYGEWKKLPPEDKRHIHLLNMYYK